MKQHLQSKAPAESLDAERARRVEQLATVETDLGAVDAELQAVVAEREPLILKSLDSPDAEGALIALEERDIKATARQRSLAAKADALRKSIAALDAEIRRRDYGAEVAAFRAEYTDLVAIADDADAKSETAAEALQGYQAAAAALQRHGRRLGFTYLNRLGDRDVAAGSFLFRIDPAREIAQQIDRRYRRPLKEQVADALPGWVLDAVDPPEGWQPTPTTNTDDAPSAATADTAAREEINDAH